MSRPTGIVTFVFTDIEGSTRLLADHPDTYPMVVRRIRQLVDEASGRHGGVVVGHEGDSCFVAFQDPDSAVEATAEIQTELAAEAWPAPIAPRVRAGVHTGVAERRGKDYFGLAVHVAARVADAAHGGQVLLSDATRACLTAHSHQLREMGTYRLRNLDSPVRLHQLVVAGTPPEFPAPRAIPAAGPLRPPATSFVGREAESGHIVRLLDDVRVVTLLGPGGIGKTRLALHVGSECLDRFPDGVWFADLTTTNDPASVADVIADAVGVSVRAGRDAASVTAEVLSRARGLLIVDNFEHVIEASPLIAQLVMDTEALRILVTSRERLRLNGETIVDVEPLTVDPHGAAVRLFVDRARAVRPEFDPTPADLEAIVAICRRLDGLPLAIELAAARARLLQPKEIADRLARSAISLGAGARDLHARQQTIRGTIEWSYQLLTPDERDVLEQLAVFAGPARVDAVEAVVVGPSSVSDVLVGLVDKSLVHQRVDGAGETRVRLLELVGEFAHELADAREDRQALGARHAEYFVRYTAATGRSMLTAAPDPSMRQIEADWSDIVRAYEWNLIHEPAQACAIFSSLGFFFHTTGLIHTARRWENETADVDRPPAAEAWRSITVGYVAFGFRDLPAARTAWERAIPLMSSTGDLLGEAWATMSLGATYLGDPDEHDTAVERTRAGMRLAESADSPVLIGLGHNILGEIARVNGRDDEADDAYLAGIAVARQIDDHYREATLLGNRVYIATHRGELDLALDLGRAALAIHRRHGHRNQLPWVSIAMSGAVVGQGRAEDAAILLAAAEESARRMHFEEGPGDVAENTAIRESIRQRAGGRFDEWYERGRQLSLEDVLAAVVQAPVAG